MTNTKFLYCKYDNLKSFIHHGKYLRFYDINYYKNLENDLIKDDESNKRYFHTADNIDLLQVNEIKINPNIIKGKLEISIPTRRSHVLCLSNIGNNVILFDRFEADLCIEINVDLLIEILKSYFQNIEERIEVIGKNVDYFKINEKEMELDNKKLVFKKNYEDFHIENEYRIAIFYPFDSNTMLKTSDNKYTNVFWGNHYIEICLTNKSDIKKVIVKSTRKDGSIV